ncbi:MAG: hypothetical protein ACRC1G_19775 [Bradyrhizobium sp.]|nr:hypothetical protein [Bradyrhizobium sp.]
MRRPSRNIEIFSMSVLDMFASALGAFIMVTIILFPFYNKHQLIEINARTARGLDDQIRSGTDRLRAADEEDVVQRAEIAQTGRLEVEKRQCQQNMEECKVTLAKKFLVVQIQWRERADVNLIVVDPDGNRFTPEKPNRGGSDFSNSNGQLSIDMKVGPGIEVWQNPATIAGDYKIIYHAEKLVDPSVTVGGWYIQRSTGRKKLRERTLSSIGTDLLAATITVTSSGTVTVTEPN